MGITARISPVELLHAPASACQIQSRQDTLSAAAPFRQTGRKYMSKRSGQTGSVILRYGRWVGRYYVDVPEQSKRMRIAVVLGMKSELNKTQAKLKLLGIITEAGVNTPAHLDRSQKPLVTFADIADAWEAKRLPELKESSRYTAPRLLVKYLRPFFEQMTPEEIKTGVIDDWIRRLQSKGLEPKTIHNLWKMFRAIMNWDSRQRDEARHTWSPTLPAIPDEEQRWFTQEEMKKLVNAAKGQYKVLFHLAAASGLRAGELFGLHVEDLNLNRGVIHVQRSVWRGQEVSPKTRKGYRDVWIDLPTVQLLRDFLGGRAEGRIFQTRNGTPLSSEIIRLVLHPLCDQVGIPRGGLHSFRHGRVSHLQANNAPPDFTKSQIGHSSLRTTSGYTHFSDAFKRETVERLGPSWTH
jgi:integrase